jgi:hypothetical protein
MMFIRFCLIELDSFKKGTPLTKLTSNAKIMSPEVEPEKPEKWIIMDHLFFFKKDL